MYVAPLSHCGHRGHGGVCLHYRASQAVLQGNPRSAPSTSTARVLAPRHLLGVPVSQQHLPDRLAPLQNRGRKATQADNATSKVHPHSPTTRQRVTLRDRLNCSRRMRATCGSTALNTRAVETVSTFFGVSRAYQAPSEADPPNMGLKYHRSCSRLCAAVSPAEQSHSRPSGAVYS
jgi:hypothetical protein